VLVENSQTSNVFEVCLHLQQLQKVTQMASRNPTFSDDDNAPRDYANLKSLGGIWSLVKKPVYTTLGMFALILFVKLFVFSVPAGNVAVLRIGGDVGDTVFYPGPHLSMPWQSTVYYPTRTVSEPRDSNPRDINNQPLTAEIVPQLWIDPTAVPLLYKKIGDFAALKQTIIDPQIQQATGASTPKFSPEGLVYDRPTLVANIQKELQAALSEQLKEKGVPADAVRVGLVAMTQFEFSPKVTDTLEAKAETFVKNRTATAIATITGIVADTKGQEVEIQANADAEKSKIIAEANAYAVRRKGEALDAAASVGQLEAIINWGAAGGHLPRMILSPTSPVIVNPGQSK
jgi:regulator of protease activity HflC (stomatin/prohibitin superfamily)